jgi:hypothetical protein
LEGIGLTHDLSLGGCRIESPVLVVPGFSLDLRIHVPDLERPILIEAANVQVGERSDVWSGLLSTERG